MDAQWIKALGTMTYGIYGLTTFYKDEINGMIASWVSQVSYDPLLIMVAVHQKRYSHHLIEQSGCFALHVLNRDQTEFLSRFKGFGPREKFAGLQWQPGATGCPVLEDCLAYFECRVKTKFTPGNHTLYCGEVMASRVLSEGAPLTTLDYDGVYLGKE